MQERASETPQDDHDDEYAEYDLDYDENENLTRYYRGKRKPLKIHGNIQPKPPGGGSGGAAGGAAGSAAGGSGQGKGKERARR